MAKSRYTGVSKDEITGKYMYYFKAGVDLATGKPYQERRRGFKKNTVYILPLKC